MLRGRINKNFPEKIGKNPESAQNFLLVYIAAGNFFDYRDAFRLARINFRDCSDTKAADGEERGGFVQAENS